MNDMPFVVVVFVVSFIFNAFYIIERDAYTSGSLIRWERLRCGGRWME